MRSGIAPPDAPFVLVEKQRAALRLVALSPAASKLGLEVGLPLADARGRVPELISARHDRAADEALLERIARACLRYTPSSVPDLPQGVMLDIAGCAHLHGGEAGMKAALLLQIKKWRLTARAAIANTPDAARALARFGGEDLCRLPLAALDVPGEAHLGLRRAGFRSIGDLADVPRASLAARFGAELVRLLDRLLEREDPHITPLCPLDPIRVEMRFPEPIARSDDVLEAIEVLIGQAGMQLAQRGEGGRAFAASLYRSDGYIAHLAVETGAPTRDPAVVMRLIRERIDSLADPLDPGFGYDHISLHVPHSEILPEQQGELEDERRRPPDMASLLDRLTVRYGGQHILRFTAHDSHIPERMGGVAPLGSGENDPRWPPLPAGEAPLRPLMMLDPPQRIEVLALVPDGPLKRFRWRGRDYLVAAQEGPERLAPEWWRRREGHSQNPGLSRDYYRVEEEGGARFWLFRHGLYDRETDRPEWYIHGLFA